MFKNNKERLLLIQKRLQKTSDIIKDIAKTDLVCEQCNDADFSNLGTSFLKGQVDEYPSLQCVCIMCNTCGRIHFHTNPKNIDKT